MQKGDLTDISRLMSDDIIEAKIVNDKQKEEDLKKLLGKEFFKKIRRGKKK